VKTPDEFAQAMNERKADPSKITPAGRPERQVRSQHGADYWEPETAQDKLNISRSFEMQATKRWANGVLAFIALLATWAMIYYFACRLGAPRWGLTAFSCISGPVCVQVARRFALRGTNVGVEAG
jgi:hypothetical protein